MIQPTVRSAREDEIDAVSALIALSFGPLDATAYLVPPLSDRQRISSRYFTLNIGHALDYGRIEVIDGDNGLSAAAVWFDHTRDVPDVPDYERRLADLAGPYLTRLKALDDLFGEHHPHEPHWQLAFLAVDPRCQNSGLGSALLEHGHAPVDAIGLPQYLEASNHNSARLYQRHGYRDMNVCSIHLPDGTPFFRMWRSTAHERLIAV